MPYDPKTIEPKWQKYWQENRTFEVQIDYDKPKFYALDMFPYPSGAGLHVGHPEGYTATDIVSRYKRMRGYCVLHPMGWDAYGLPAERYAIRTGVHPSVTTQENIATFRGQIKRLGFSYDWSREVSTTDPAYMRWTQWIFLKLHERGLAYQAEVAVNWCPAQGTVLANEEVKDGRYVETGDPVERRLMRQWMLRITRYAERLLDDLDDLDWPDGIKAMQRNWIGKSEGAEITFAIEGAPDTFRAFTTRPDTLYGATYCVLAPEHPLVRRVTTASQRGAVDAYVERTARLSEIQRKEVGTKTGVFSGAYAINPANAARIPIWVADYVLLSYGTGAVMAVPAHDQRDHDFASAFGLPMIQVVEAPNAPDIALKAYEEGGTMINSSDLDGMSVDDAHKTIVARLEAAGCATRSVQYRLRDWLFSRQRYWGEPIPILHDGDGGTSPVPERDLPLLPPALDDYRPTDDGKPPLARAEHWLRTTDPRTGAPAWRETNTMPQWAGSCWYYLRFLDPTNEVAFVDPAKERYWMPVDLYVGGAEHAVLHLLYARFWHKVLYDCGLVSTKEPFRKLFNQGMILAFSYRDAKGKYHDPASVKRDGDIYVTAAEGTEVSQQIEKMSKSRLNVVNPDDVVDAYGADAMRLYEMFMGPLDVTKPWQTAGVAGVSRFLHRSWRLLCNDDDAVDEACVTDTPPDAGLAALLHKTIQIVTDDIEGLRFNTAISRLMELVNVLTPMRTRPRSVLRDFVLLLSPFAPHIAEEMWAKLGNPTTLAYHPWPVAVASIAEGAHELQEYPVQINGRVRARVRAAARLTKDELLTAVRQDADVQHLIADARIVREIVVPGRLVNFVVEVEPPRSPVGLAAEDAEPR